MPKVRLSGAQNAFCGKQHTKTILSRSCVSQLLIGIKRSQGAFLQYWLSPVKRFA